MNERILTCYFPTTVALIDDDAKYIHGIIPSLDVTQAVVQFFGSSAEAIKTLKKYQANRFTDSCLPEPIMSQRESGTLETKIRKLQAEIYNPKRYREISVLVLDYDMPGINGIQLCDELADKPFKKILLTGKADEETVFKAFNDGKIHKYVRKESLNFKEELNAAIRELQRSYFQDLSSVVVDSIIRDPEFVSQAVKDPVFIELANTICQEKSIVEYHLTDTQGSFLLLDKDANPSWLVVAGDEQMRMYFELAEDVDAAPDMLEALKKKQVIPYFQTDADFQQSPAKWKQNLHPAKALQGKETYYYAHVTDPNAYNINKQKVLSYHAFLETL